LLLDEMAAAKDVDTALIAALKVSPCPFPSVHKSVESRNLNILLVSFQLKKATKKKKALLLLCLS